MEPIIETKAGSADGENAEVMLAARGLSFSYGDHRVLDDIAFEVPKGSLCGLFGPNGSGKTTLFKCCLGLLKHSGHVTINGVDITSKGTRDVAKSVAYVPQEHRPPFPFSVFEVVLMGRTPHMGSGAFAIAKEDRDICYESLERLGISELAQRSYNALSGGQRQLVLIARALAQQTPMVLLDEPTSALDFSNQLKVWHLLQHLTSQGVTILACAHDPNHVAWFTDHVIMVANAGVLDSGATNDVFTQENLNTLYDHSCDVRTVGNKRVVLPSDLLQQGTPIHTLEHNFRQHDVSPESDLGVTEASVTTKKENHDQ